MFSLSDIKDNSVVAISGFNMAITPEYLILELYHQYTKADTKEFVIVSDALPATPGER
jgi:acyl CoA:acetate/3-ketoacid CoA transferase